MKDNQVNLFFVSGLPLDVTEKEMKDYFLPDHELIHCKLYSTHCGIKSSYGYVGLKSNELDIQEYVKTKKLKNKDIFIELIDEENESDNKNNDDNKNDDHHQNVEKESSPCEEYSNTNNICNLRESVLNYTNETNKNDNIYEDQNNICYNNEDVKDEKNKKNSHIKLKKKETKKYIKIINESGDITKEGLSILENMNMQDVVILIIRIQELVRMDPQTAIKMLNENKTIYYSLVHALFLLGILNVEITPLDNEEIKESHFYQMKNYFQYICMNDKKSTMQDVNESKINMDNESENYSYVDSSYQSEEEMINEDIISVEENDNENEKNNNTLIDNMDNTFNSDNIIYDDDNNKIYSNDGDDYHHNLINKNHTHVNKKPLYNNYKPYITNMKNDKKRKIQETTKTLLNDANYNYGDNNITYEDKYYNMNNDTNMEYNNMKGVNNQSQFIDMRIKNKQKKDYPYKFLMQEYIKVNDSSNNNNNNNNINSCGNISLSSDKRKGNLYGNNRMNMKNNNNNNNNNNHNNHNNNNKNKNNKNTLQKGIPKPLYSFIKNKDVNRNHINYNENDFVQSVNENAADSGDTLLHNYNNNNNSSSSNNNLYRSNKEPKNHHENTHFHNLTNYNVNNKQQLYRNNTDMRSDKFPDKLINKMKNTNNQRRGIKLIDRKNNPGEDNYNENKIKIKCINIEEEEKNNNKLLTSGINSNLTLLLKKLKISLNDIPYAEEDLIKEIINEKSILQNILISKYVDMLNWTNEQVLRVLSIRKSLKKIGYNINGII
ncbi:conserved Plasmodium protein, unknown function [Plasmodium sp. gorilla clade G3]|nr:conserved Plasmodium protein, unknown function [Plasmodium sp. gorilla clade G3]